MLFRVLVEVFFAPLEALSNALPVWSYTPTGWGDTTITVPSWVPITTFVTVAVSSVAWVLGLIAFTAAEWVYRHIPQVFGTGPGAG